MGVAAVPRYLGSQFNETPPGHRFGLYFSCWKAGEWALLDGEKRKALEQVEEFRQDSILLLEAIQMRQRTAMDALGVERVWSVETRSTAPFVTGVGLEHPLENGFAFLNPYGLPYLPGSGIKGVLRKAAEELALGLYGTGEGRKGWNILAVWCLFGFEANSRYLVGPDVKEPDVLQEEAKRLQEAYLLSIKALQVSAGDLLGEFLQKTAQDKKVREEAKRDPQGFFEHLAHEKDGRQLREKIKNRGALMFWDVFPKPAGDRLRMDILNPHHTKYYQEGRTPADCENPMPNFFLTVPEGSDFAFYVQCNTYFVPGSLRAPWRTLVESAFQHAFDWLGFGAKTAVGYGAMDVASLRQNTRSAVVPKRSSWVDKKIAELSSKPGVKADDALRGKSLAEAVRDIEDPARKKEVLQDIETRWKEKGWWDAPSGKSAKEARKIYEEIKGERPTQ